MVALLVAAAVLANLLVLPIGGADMPVVISLLNAFTGLSAAATGVALNNTALIVAGMLVGASGTHADAADGGRDEPLGALDRRRRLRRRRRAAGRPRRTARHRPLDQRRRRRDPARLRAAGRDRPGYGLAVSQAQHALRDMTRLLEARGVTVKYAVHPVAGRMPGHMNVLLAEAEVPYDQLVEMDDINPEFPRTDVALVIGANDVVNPDARTEPGRARSTGCRSSTSTTRARSSSSSARCAAATPASRTRCSSIPKAAMLFGDAKASITEVGERAQGAGRDRRSGGRCLRIAPADGLALVFARVVRHGRHPGSAPMSHPQARVTLLMPADTSAGGLSPAPAEILPPPPLAQRRARCPPAIR